MIHQSFGAKSQLSLIRRDLSEQLVTKFDGDFRCTFFQAGLLMLNAGKKAIVVDAFTTSVYHSEDLSISLELTKFGMSLSDRVIIKLMGSRKGGAFL